MAMGIDQEIQRRMDAYRGNPQGLQQRYQMSQQLLDLLALQKLKAEKDAVARQMQAQMQQQPGTVAQQMEQEMVGRTKQEMAQQVGGVMQQKARQQQQGMARMAQAAARPQGGLGSLAPQTAQSAPRMAGGGIVAFANGGTKEDAELRARIETAMKLGASQEDIANLLSRIGRSPEEFGLDALVPSRPRQMAAVEAPGAEGLRFERPSAGSTLAAIEAIPTAAFDTPMPMSVAEQAKQALATGPRVTPPVAGSLMAPPSESQERRTARTPFERREQLKDQINARLEKLNVRRLRMGSERFLSEERKQDIAEADRLRRNLAILQGGGNDPEKTAAAVRSVERGMFGTDVGPSTAGPATAAAVEPATQEAAPQKDMVEDAIEAIGGQRVASAGAGAADAGVGPLLDAPPYFPTGRSTAANALRSLGGQSGAAPPAVPDIVSIQPQPKLDLTEITAPEVGEAESAAGLRSLLQGQAGEAIPDMTQLMEQYGGALGQKERMERRQRRIDELSALDRAQLDPERARKDRLMQVLAAAGGASNIGTMGARMANAAVSSRIRQEQDERARLRQRLAMADEMDLADLDISKESLKNALGVIDSAKARRIQAMDALGNLSRAEIARKEANAKLELEAGKANNDNIYREYTTAKEQAEAVLARQDAGIEQLTEVARLMQESYSADLERRMDQLEQDARYIELQVKAERTAEEDQELREMVAEVQASAAAYANMSDYFAIMDQLNKRALQNAGISLNSGR